MGCWLGLRALKTFYFCKVIKKNTKLELKAFLQRILQEIVKKNNTWNIRRLVNETIVQSTQQTSVLYWRFPDYSSIYFDKITGAFWKKNLAFVIKIQIITHQNLIEQASKPNIIKLGLSRKHTKFEKNLPHGFDKSADLLSKRQNYEKDFFKVRTLSALLWQFYEFYGWPFCFMYSCLVTPTKYITQFSRCTGGPRISWFLVPKGYHEIRASRILKPFSVLNPKLGPTIF